MTGPGHKTAQHLIEGEAFRRIMAGEAPSTLDEFAQQLADWLTNAFPQSPAILPSAIEDQIRETWHHRHDMVRGGGS